MGSKLYNHAHRLESKLYNHAHRLESKLYNHAHRLERKLELCPLFRRTQAYIIPSLKRCFLCLFSPTLELVWLVVTWGLLVGFCMGSLACVYIHYSNLADRQSTGTTP